MRISERKNRILQPLRRSYLAILAWVMVSGAFLGGCSDDIDDSNLYTFKGDMVMSYLKSRAEFSDYCDFLSVVKLSNKSNSTLSDLLNARGNYTVFAPTNDALHTYIDSIMGQTGYDFTQLSDSIKEIVVKNSLIDNGDDEAYLSTDFNVEGALGKVNMSDRYVSISFGTTGSKGVVIVNGQSTIVEPDIEVENGAIHVVDRVVSSSMSTLSSLLEETSNTKVFSRLLTETGWADSLVNYLDQSYEEYHPETTPGVWSGENYETPEHRKYGYTAFVEPDNLLSEAWGIAPQIDEITGRITNWEDILPVIQQQCEAMSLYKEAQDNSTNPNVKNDLKDPDNAVNQFVAYHLLRQAMPFNKLVIHHNELGYAYNTPEVLSINCTNYYETMGKERRLMKIVEGRATNGKFINRRSTYNNGRKGNYDEITVLDPGTMVYANNGTLPNNALNGNYFLIDRVLVYDKPFVTDLSTNRMRFDVLDFLPEMSSNNIRRPDASVSIGIPTGYFENLTATEESNVCYLTEYTPQSWRDYMGDEITIVGQYDFTYRLPAVPETGTYELRVGLSNNSSRGMAQIYLGTDKSNPPAIGLPVDLRLSGSDPLIGVEADVEDETVNIAGDKALRNHGYLKAPQFFGLTSASGVSSPMRDVVTGNIAIRRIITTMTFEKGETYYLRFKSVLDNPNGQFFFDYLELVPKTVVTQGEDIW